MFLSLTKHAESNVIKQTLASFYLGEIEMADEVLAQLESSRDAVRIAVDEHAMDVIGPNDGQVSALVQSVSLCPSLGRHWERVRVGAFEKARRQKDCHQKV